MVESSYHISLKLPQTNFIFNIPYYLFKPLKNNCYQVSFFRLNFCVVERKISKGLWQIMSANDNWMNITSDPIILEFYISFLFSLLNRSQSLKCAIYCYKQLLRWLHLAWKINNDFAVISNLLLRFSYLCLPDGYIMDISYMNIFIVLNN